MRALLIILVIAFSSTAAARPNFGPTCGSGGGCHSTGLDPAGSISTLLTEIEIALGDSGLVSFALSGAPTTGGIGVLGLDAVGLGATIVNTDDWTAGTGYSYSDVFANTTTEYLLDLAIPGDATLGTYTIDFIFAGPNGGTNNNARWATDIASHSFDVTVANIPLPAAVWLFGSGLIGLVGIARKRKAT